MAARRSVARGLTTARYRDGVTGRLASGARASPVPEQVVWGRSHPPDSTCRRARSDNGSLVTDLPVRTPGATNQNEITQSGHHSEHQQPRPLASSALVLQSEFEWVANADRTKVTEVQHAQEIAEFSSVALRDDVVITSTTYQDVLLNLAKEHRADHTAYIDYMIERYV